MDELLCFYAISKQSYRRFGSLFWSSMLLRQRDSSKEGREVVRMRRTARRHQHKGNGQTCSGSRKTLSSLFCFPGLNATQTQPVPSFRHDWGTDSIMHSSMQVAPLLLACSCHHKVPIAEVGFSNAKNNRMN
ncbi:hypothetical protein BHM03_00019958 [Ensete ventricosum]|nr:hypothetical protein BHM03_00019958 [Ensete ventricosum]